MIVSPNTITKIANSANKFSCIIEPTIVTQESEGDIVFFDKNMVFDKAPILAEERKIEFITQQKNSIFVKNTYPFAINIKDIEINKDENRVYSHVVDTYAKITTRITSKACFVAMVTNNHIGLIEEMTLKSLYTYGCYPDIPFVIVGYGLVQKVKEILSKYNCIIIDFFENEKFFTANHKMAIWMLPHIVHSEYFVVMDCDILVGKDIGGFLDIIYNYHTKNKIFCSSHPQMTIKWNFEAALKDKDQIAKIKDIYGISDVMFKKTGYSNSGFYIATRDAMLDINSLAQTYKEKIRQTQDNFYFTEETLFNICVQRLNNKIIMPPTYNYTSINIDDFDIREDGIYKDGIQYAIVHFIAGPKKHYYKKVKEYNKFKINKDNLYVGETHA